MSRSGRLLDAAGLELVTAASTLSAPQVASSGDGYLVVWADSREGGSIRGARVTRAGAVLDPGGFRLSSDAFAVEPHVTYNGSHYLVVYGTIPRGVPRPTHCMPCAWRRTGACWTPPPSCCPRSAPTCPCVESESPWLPMGGTRWWCGRKP